MNPFDFLKLCMFVHDADTNSGGEGGENKAETTSAPSAETENTDTGAKESAANENMVPLSRFNEVNNRLKQIEAEQAKREQAEAEAATKALEAKEEWQTLASQRQERIEALEPLEAQMATLTERFTETFNAEIKDWPEEVTGLAPDGEMSVVQMLDWLDKHRPLVAKIAEQAAPTPKGNGPRPKPADNTNRREPVEPVIGRSKF